MHLRRRRQVTTAGLAVCAVALAACSSSSSSTTSGSTSSTSSASAPASTSVSGTLNGSGSTLQQVFIEAAISSFKSVAPSITVNYGAGGSGKGRTDLASGVVNYAASDTPIPSSEMATFKGKTVLLFPDVIAPVTVSYNLSGVTNLKLTPDVIAKIFEAKITTWNNPAIKSINPGVSLPSTPITIAHRSDSSGTTDNFSEFLVAAAPGVWTLGSGSVINWPSTSRAGNGNPGVAQIIKSTPGAIGYVDYADAKASGLVFASVQNKAGDYVAPSLTAASAAASSASVKPDLAFSAIWAPGATSYPITAQSFILVYETQPNATDVSLLKSWIGYLLGPGQQLTTSVDFAPLPTSIAQMAKAQLSKITS